MVSFFRFIQLNISRTKERAILLYSSKKYFCSGVLLLRRIIQRLQLRHFNGWRGFFAVEFANSPPVTGVFSKEENHSIVPPVLRLEWRRSRDSFAMEFYEQNVIPLTCKLQHNGRQELENFLGKLNETRRRMEIISEFCGTTNELQRIIIPLLIDLSASSVFAASVMHFSFLAAFFWLNTMCFNIWWTFR